jgi:hypothetical protein
MWPAKEVTSPEEHERLGDPSCSGPPDSSEFYPHGLSVSDSSDAGGPTRLAVVTHAERDTVQLFDVTEDGRLLWRGCIFYPEHTTGHDVALLEDGSLIATNYAPAGGGAEGARYRLRGALGFDTGDVLAWSLDNGWTHIPSTAGAIPNGVISARDESEFYFADAGGWRVAVVPRANARAEVVRVRLGGAPNNLTVTSSGTVLATVVTFSGDLPLLCSVGGRACRLGWAVWEVDPTARSAKELFAEEGQRIASATTALEVGNYLFIGTMADDRIGVYRRH